MLQAIEEHRDWTYPLGASVLLTDLKNNLHIEHIFQWERDFGNVQAKSKNIKNTSLIAQWWSVSTRINNASPSDL